MRLIDLAPSRHDREAYNAELYDQIFDRVLSRIRRERGPELQKRCELSS